MWPILITAATASSTQDARIEGSAAFLEGKFDGAGLNGQGELVLGMRSANTAAIDDAAYLLSSATLKGRLYFGAGYPASVVAYDGKTASILAKFPGEHAVSAVAADDRHLYAATLPAASIYKVDDRGGTTAFVDFSTGSSVPNYVWGLAVHRGALYVSLGGHFPAVYKVDLKSGKKELLYSLEGKSKNITALLVTEAGVFFGDDIGRVFRLAHGASRPHVLYAFSDAEVRMLAPMAQGLAVAVNSRRFAPPPPPPPPPPKDQARQPEERGEEGGGDYGVHADLQKAVEDLETKLAERILEGAGKEESPALQEARDAAPMSIDAKPSPPQPTAKPESPAAQPPSAPPMYQDPFGKGEGNVFWMTEDGQSVHRLWFSQTSTVLAICPDEDAVWAATSSPARLYRITKDGSERLYFEASSKDLSAVGFMGKTLVAGASNPAAAISLVSASQGDYVSKVFDAGFPGRVGRVEVSGADGGDLHLRSGATAEVDSGWTEYKSLAGALMPQPIGRFFQVKCRIKSPTTVLRRIRIPYRVHNQYPRLVNLSADVVRSQEGQPDQKDVRFQWDVTNLDNDQLQYQVFYQPTGSKSFLPVFEAGDEPRSVKNVNLPAEQFSDGLYRFRLTVTDAPSNGPSEALGHEMEFPLVLIDRTPPMVEMSKDGKEVRWKSADAASRVSRAEYRIDGGPWMAVLPDDGLFDASEESGRFALPASATVVDFRSYDERENSRIQSLAVK